MMLAVAAYVPAAILGGILGVTLMSGKAFFVRAFWPLPIRGPEIVSRKAKPREYWATVFATAVCFALFLWWASCISG